ncbi:MAG: glycogen/starch/alpha-glucan phosphorylase [Chromatiales bacterium]|jgi:starch phosphorylase
MDTDALGVSIAKHLTYSIGKTPPTATPRDWLSATALTIRDRMIERMMRTMHRYYDDDARRVYYLSMEYLLGRTLDASVLNLGIEREVRTALSRFGVRLDDLWEIEEDAALGNGGLGRLAACLMESMATLDLPGYGYGIRYEFGMFTQRIEDGRQVEQPDNWLRYGNPWEFPRPEVLYPVRFYGRVDQSLDADGELRFRWVEGQQVMAMAYDMPVQGYGTDTANNLRLWSAKATREFELDYFNEGNYIEAVAEKTRSENLSKVLYPDDSSHLGRELRLKQEYFFVSASLQDILRRYLSDHACPDAIAEKVAIQLNDTHPALGIAEWMRLLVDEQGMNWVKAWEITRNVFSYTNHTLLPEALEVWPVPLMERILPRHLQIILEINRRFLDEVARRFPGDTERLRRMSLIDESGERAVRMAHLAVVGSHRVNGVSDLHTRLLGQTLFADFHAMDPDRLVNVTNGVTPRRWILQANPALSRLLDETLGTGWIADLDRLRTLSDLADDPAFVDRFRWVKQDNKVRLARLIHNRLGIRVYPDSLFDVQVKRIHEYKRQVLKLLHVVTLFNRIRRDPQSVKVPRTVIFAGKTAPGYDAAKLIIKLINDVAAVINAEPAVHSRLKVVFVPNYDVSVAAEVIPAADLSEQISTAGMEASGTGNMKLALNGALTIGTLDGANIEMREAVGEENFFSFGLSADGIAGQRARGYRPRLHYEESPELRQALGQIATGLFSPDEPGRYRSLVGGLLDYDPYRVLADYADYLRAQAEADILYRSPALWARKAILNVARMGRFSIDRTTREYAETVWRL